METEYRVLEPEVAGGLGEWSILDHSTRPPTIEKLHYEFEGWLGDDLLTSHPCFIVTLPLKESLLQFAGSGYSFGEVTRSKSPLFEAREPEVVLPEFAWFKVCGLPGRDDAGLSDGGALVVSQALLNVLRRHRIPNCTVRRRPYKQKPNDP